MMSRASAAKASLAVASLSMKASHWTGKASDQVDGSIISAQCHPTCIFPSEILLDLSSAVLSEPRTQCRISNDHLLESFDTYFRSQIVLIVVPALQVFVNLHYEDETDQ